jgi:hypothetical protein
LSGLTLEGAWANPGQVGTASDINTDGIGDWGGNKSTGTAYIGINSAAGGYQPGSDFKIATVSFNIVGKNPDATAASGTKFAASPFMGISYLAYTALWTQDGPSTATANRKYAYTGTQNASYPQGQYLSGSALQFLIEGGTPVEVDYATLPPSNSNAPGGLGTMAKLLAGRGPAGATFDNWRAASPAEASGAAVFVGFNSPSPKIISDVVDLNGIPDGILFVLSMTYSDVGLVDEQGSAAQGHIQLGTLSPGGQWVPAQSPSIGPVLGPVPSFTAGLPALGTWGVDTVQNVVWQVVDHNSQFAVVPEPATVGLLSLAALGLTIRRRRAIA